MKCLYILLFVVVVQGFVGQPREKRSLELQAPTLAGLTTNKDGSLSVKWNKVISPDSNDPVLGYVVKVWELQDKIVYKYKIIDGKQVLVQETEEAKMDTNVIPTETPREIKVEGADTTEVIVKDIKHKVQYHIRILAYTKNNQSPLSSASGVKLWD